MPRYRRGAVYIQPYRRYVSWYTGGRGRYGRTLSHPLHPYTQALFASIPDFNKKRTVSLKGELPMYT
ncbi:MAG: hypothetical protein ACLTBV_17440 [Enterocloster bolteae]